MPKQTKSSLLRQWIGDDLNFITDGKVIFCQACQKHANPPPSKKTKPNTSSSKKDEDEPSWVLDKNRFIKVREFKGRVFVDIREYYESDGELKPGKKGISLSTSQWQKLKNVISEVDDAVKEKC